MNSPFSMKNVIFESFKALFAMVFYWHNSDMGDGNPKTKFDQQIKTALTKI
jgi:hypothetical protein